MAELLSTQCTCESMSRLPERQIGICSCTLVREMLLVCVTMRFLKLSHRNDGQYDLNGVGGLGAGAVVHINSVSKARRASA